MGYPVRGEAGAWKFLINLSNIMPKNHGFWTPSPTPPKYNKTTFFTPLRTLCNIYYKFTMNFIILIFPPFSHKKQKNHRKKHTEIIPISYRYHSEGSAHPKRLPKITLPQPHSLHKIASFPQNRNTNFIKPKHFAKCNLCIFLCTLSCILRNKCTFILQK